MNSPNPYEAVMSDREEDLRAEVAPNLAEAAVKVDRAMSLLDKIADDWYEIFQLSGRTDLLARRSATLTRDAARELEQFHIKWLEEKLGLKVEIISS